MAILGAKQFTYEVSGHNWGKLPEGWFYKEATSVDVDSKDNVYVFNRGNHPMIVFDPDGNPLRSWGEGIFTNPHAVTIGPDDTVWCVDNAQHSIRQFTPEGKLLFTLAEPNKPAPEMSGKPFNRPTRVAFDPRNADILVADGYRNARVHRFSPDGKTLLASWGESGTEPGQFNIVHDIAIDTTGRIYIADRENRRIQVFSPDGTFETQWVNLSRAVAIHIPKTDDQLVYVGEYYGVSPVVCKVAMRLGPRVSIFDTKGTVLARLGDHPYGDEPGRFYAPHGVATDSKGDIYVAEVSFSEWDAYIDTTKELRSMQKLIKTTPRE
ncbi:MAG: peptidyl-alpha-hydroxyglycine alpha-amidating lyase family protein [Planctomycetota bacterium]|jgi:DNA-binding beta-propeller fold protein YncE